MALGFSGSKGGIQKKDLLTKQIELEIFKKIIIGSKKWHLDGLVQKEE